jgi:hypothetical protein
VTPPWAIRRLADRARQLGQDGIRPELGPFVLVGSTGKEQEKSGTFRFATKSVRLDEIENDMNERVFDLDQTVVYPLRKRATTFVDVILVGRASTNDVHIDDKTVSKLHARIRLNERGFVVEDAGSRNGTFLDGERILDRADVGSGDAVAFGSRAFRVYESAQFCDILIRL